MHKTVQSVFALFAILSPIVSHAAGRTQSQTHTAVITAVGADTISVKNGVHAGYKIVVIANDGRKTTQPAANIDTYTLKPWTTITLNGLPAKLSDLKAGLKVQVSLGTDPKVAQSIVALSVPPPQKAATSDKSTSTKSKGPRKLGQGIDAYKVTAITKDTITVAQNGGKKSIAYRIGTFTEIEVNGKESTLDKIKVGMEVAVIAGTDPTLAASIKASDES